MAKKYILDEFNNKIEVTDEVGNTTVNEVKCCVSSTPYKMAFVTQAKYNELEAAGLLQQNTIYEITDDTLVQDINTQLEEHNQTLAEHTNQLVELEARHLYRHNLRLIYNENDYATYIDINLTIINNSQEKITAATLPNYFTNDDIRRQATGRYSSDRKGTIYYICKPKYSEERYGIGYLSGESYQEYEKNINTFTTVTDVVEQIY